MLSLGGYSMKPIIGIANDVMHDTNCLMSRGIPEQEILLCTKPVFDVIIESGGIPLGLPILNNGSQIESIIDKIDGLCLPSGPDVFPGFANQETNKYLGEIRYDKDESDIAYIRVALEKRKPIIGLCRGMQIINIALGGNLIQDISAYIKNAKFHKPLKVHSWLPIHSINIDEGSFLYRSLLKKEISVNSFHHQSIGKIGKGLEIVASAEDGVIEAVECRDPLIWGVQFHPEYMYKKSPLFLNIFRDFIKECYSKR